MKYYISLFSSSKERLASVVITLRQPVHVGEHLEIGGDYPARFLITDITHDLQAAPNDEDDFMWSSSIDATSLADNETTDKAIMETAAHWHCGPGMFDFCEDLVINSKRISDKWIKDSTPHVPPEEGSSVVFGKEHGE